MEAVSQVQGVQELGEQEARRDEIARHQEELERNIREIVQFKPPLCDHQS